MNNDPNTEHCCVCGATPGAPCRDRYNGHVLGYSHQRRHHGDAQLHAGQNQRMTLNDLLFKGSTGLDACYDRPHVEIAWDQWSRTRIWCKHGCFEGISDFMDLSEGIERAMAGFRASVEAGIHYGCWADCPVPADWVAEGSWNAGDTTDCDMVRGHDGEHGCFPDDETENAYWVQRRVYYVNGHNMTGKRTMPTPIGA